MILVALFLLLLSGCAKRSPIVTVPNNPRIKATATLGDIGSPCDARITRQVALVNQDHLLTPCGGVFEQPLPNLPVFGVLLLFPNQGPLSPENFPAKPGEAGFVYDGGDTVWLIENDGVHLWKWRGELVGDAP